MSRLLLLNSSLTSYLVNGCELLWSITHYKDQFVTSLFFNNEINTNRHIFSAESLHTLTKCELSKSSCYIQQWPHIYTALYTFLIPWTSWGSNYKGNRGFGQEFIFILTNTFCNWNPSFIYRDSDLCPSHDPPTHLFISTWRVLVIG